MIPGGMSDLVIPERDPCTSCTCEEDRSAVVFCGECSAWVHEAAVRACVKVVGDYIAETHKHVGVGPNGACIHEGGDRCDITAALRVVAGRLRDLSSERVFAPNQPDNGGE